MKEGAMENYSAQMMSIRSHSAREVPQRWLALDEVAGIGRDRRGTIKLLALAW